MQFLCSGEGEKELNNELHCTAALPFALVHISLNLNAAADKLRICGG